MDDFRCSATSADDGEPMVGTAPTDAAMLLVEAPGPWGRKAIEENRLPDEVRTHLAGLDGMRPQLIRRSSREGTSVGTSSGTRIFHAVADESGFAVKFAQLDDVRDLPDVVLADLAAYESPLWLVCTNGRRDRCCTELGRPIVAALAECWPEDTWETSHLGGHRFAGTLLALPSGLTLGRLSSRDAVRACEEVAAGRVPAGVVRGRAGRPGEEQVRELHVLGGGDPRVEVVATPGPPRRQSCGDLTQKATTIWEVRPTSES